MNKVLIVDDEEAQREMLAGFLKKKGFQTETASGGSEAMARYGGFFAPLAVVDMKMPDMDGLELLTRLRDLNPFIQVVVLTAFDTVETAVEAMRRGAYGYLTKPVNLDELLVNLNRAAEEMFGYPARAPFGRMAVRAHGGRIEVETELGVVTMFTVRLPAE